MKILFVCENYFPHLGGAEILFKNLAERFVKKDLQTTVVTHKLKNTLKNENICGVEVHRISSFFSRYVFSFSSLFKAVQLARKHDVVQTTTFNGAFPAWLAAKLMRKPVVLTVHEVWQGKWQEITGFPRWKSTIHEFLESLIYKLPFDHYVCVSEATKNDLLKVLQNKKKTSKALENISVVYNGLDYNFWNRERIDLRKIKETRKKYYQDTVNENIHEKINKNANRNTKIFFSWGRPGASKGFEYLIQAMPLVVEKYPGAVLLLMFGSKEKYPEKYQELLAIIQKINLPKNIKVIDSLPYEELKYLVALADSVIVPSISEGFGYTALEAMALEKPVMVSNAGSLPEIVGGKHLIFQKKNSQDLAEKMLLAVQGKWNFSEPKKFTWEECVESYVKVYEKLRSE